MALSYSRPPAPFARAQLLADMGGLDELLGPLRLDRGRSLLGVRALGERIDLVWEPLNDLVELRGDVASRWTEGRSGHQRHDLVGQRAVETSRRAG
jgi:hypothetical protein